MPSMDERLLHARTPTAKAYDIAHVMFDRPDVDRARDFLVDFGLSPSEKSPGVFHAAGGYGPCYFARKAKKPRFVGFALRVASYGDLQALARLSGASAIEPAEEWSEGAQVRLRDPAGNEVRAVFGPRTMPADVRAPLQQNRAGSHVRLNEEQRPARKPSIVLRLGHVAIGVVDFFRCVRWYMETFGMLASDIQTIGDGDPALAFLRCDRGGEPTDHHTLVVAQNVVNVLSHCAFECIDIDDIAMGQEHLQSRGWTHAWGVGRHVQGSQIFDYWRDPWNDKVEHFADSDMFTADYPTSISALTSGGLYQWGPPVPQDFEAPKLTPRLVWTALKNRRTSDEMTFKRIRLVLKTIGAPPRNWVRNR